MKDLVDIAWMIAAVAAAVLLVAREDRRQRRKLGRDLRELPDSELLRRMWLHKAFRRDD